MAAIARSRRVGANPTRLIMAGLGAVVIVVAVGLVALGFPGGAAPKAAPTATVTRGAITASVAGIGAVAAAQTLDLSFQSAGTVSEVLVHEGDTVVAGQSLARLDDRVLQSQVANARANLDAARAKLAQGQKGNAKPEDLAVAQSQLASARASYDKLAAGPLAPDVANAEAVLKSAEANVGDVLAGPTASDVAAARASVTASESQLAQAQKDLGDLRAQPKPTDVQVAQLAVEQSKDSLWSAQLSRDATCGRSKGQGGDCQSANATVAAQETAVNQAMVKLAQAKQPATAAQLAAAEQSVQSARAGLTSAKAKLAQVQAGPTTASRQSALSQVDEAKASLAKTRTSVTTNDLIIARASVDQAKANLDKLTAPSTQSDLAIQQASVDQAEEALTQAQINLDNATLQAPFAGVVSVVNVVPGSPVGGNTAVARVIDRGTLHVDLKLGENDVVKVAVGQPATLTSDALAGWSARGTVSYIAPAAETANGVATYAVRASFSDVDPSLRVGMTANVGITTAHHDGVLLVPNTALLPKGAGHVVQQLGVDQKTTSDVDVQVGLTDGTMTEIIGGLTEGAHFIPFPAANAPKPAGGFFGG